MAYKCLSLNLKLKNIASLNRILYILFLYTLCSFWATNAQTSKIIDKKVNFGFAPAHNRKIDVIIIHSTFNNSGGEHYDIDLIIKQFSHYKVSAHYVIGRQGEIFNLVDEKNIAYHAGKSSLPDGRTGTNTCSIGIELMTSFSDTPTEAQIEALIMLVNDIKLRHRINFVLRHSDIAPARKTDPWNMNWDDFIARINTSDTTNKELKCKE